MTTDAITLPAPAIVTPSFAGTADPGVQYAADHPHHGWFRTCVWSHDHKMIGKQYLFAAFFFMLVSGLLAMAIRWQLAFPGNPLPLVGALLPASLVTAEGALLPQGYNAVVTMHATTAEAAAAALPA